MTHGPTWTTTHSLKDGNLKKSQYVIFVWFKDPVSNSSVSVNVDYGLGILVCNHKENIQYDNQEEKQSHGIN